MQAERPPSTLRRALLAGAVVAPAFTSTLAAAGVMDTELVRLDLCRQALLERMEATPIEDREGEAAIATLCDQMDACAAAMTEIPIQGLAGARAKLRCLEELYHHPMHQAGWDLVLFNQVLAWMSAELKDAA